jgi:WD40 repeat protein
MILSLLFTPFLSSALDQAPISFQLLTEIKEAKRGISEVKFSPDGATLGVGARDNSIYLYSTSQQFKRRAKFSKHNAGINQFDFSADGKAIQSCCRCVRVVCVWCVCVCGVCVCVCACFVVCVCLCSASVSKVCPYVRCVQGGGRV